MPKSGLLWVASKISDPAETSPFTFNTWYNDTHIPDVLATSEVKTASRYQNIDPAGERQYLALYPVSDVDWLSSEEFGSIAISHEVFRTKGKSGSVFEVADFDTRIYEFVHGFEAEGVKSGMCIPKLNQSRNKRTKCLLRVDHFTN